MIRRNFRNPLCNRHVTLSQSLQSSPKPNAVILTMQDKIFSNHQKETNYSTRCSNPDGYHVTLNCDLNQLMSLAICCQMAGDDKWLVEVEMGPVALLSTGSCCSREIDSCLLHWEGRGDELGRESCLVCFYPLFLRRRYVAS